MKKATLRFQTMIDLVDFVHVTKSANSAIDKEELAATSGFSEAELELSIHGYNANLAKTQAIS